MRIFIEMFLFGLEAIVGIKAFGLILTFALNDNYYCFVPALMYTLIFIGLFKIQEFFIKMHKNENSNENSESWNSEKFYK